MAGRMRVLSLCEYLASGETLEPDHFKPYNIVKAIKGEPFKGYAWLEVDGRSVKLEASNREVAFQWAAERLATTISGAVKGPVTIVPVPGHLHCSTSDVEAGGVFRLAALTAERLRQRGCVAYPFSLLHLHVPQPSAHQEGGTRDVEQLKQNLKVVNATNIATVIIMDDVVTSGGHLLAAHQVVAAAGHRVHDTAFSVGRTVYVKGQALGTEVDDCPRPMKLPEPPEDMKAFVDRLLFGTPDKDKSQ